MTRDLRDPEALGTVYAAAREGGVPIEVAVLLPAARTLDLPVAERYPTPEERWTWIRVS